MFYFSIPGKGQEYWAEKNINEEMPACRQMLNIFHPFDPVAYRYTWLLSRDANIYFSSSFDQREFWLYKVLMLRDILYKNSDKRKLCLMKGE